MDEQNRHNASLYVHIPFCTQRCSYCDFYFVTTSRDHNRFVRALCMEIVQVARNFPDTSLSTIYFGGGTPSRLSPQAIYQILAQIHTCFQTHQVQEITLEANPEDITEEGLRELRRAGITRISLGIQSFRDADLTFLNRCHDSDQAIRACGMVHSAGFRSWSLDLIFGIPGLTMPAWQENLHHAIDMGSPHLSCYSLTVEPSTPLHRQVERGIVKPAPDVQISDQFQRTMDVLHAHDFEHYEISSFARPGHRSRHNSCYWYHINYLGIGPSAHSFWWQDGEALRWENTRNLRSYADLMESGESPAVKREILSRRDLARERIMLALRTSDGLDLDNLRRVYGVDLSEQKQTELTEMQSRGMIMQKGAQIHLTTRGMHVCDDLTARLWPA